MELTDQQWEVIAPLLPEGKSGAGLKVRPRRNNRGVLEGILWVLRTGAKLDLFHDRIQLNGIVVHQSRIGKDRYQLDVSFRAVDPGVVDGVMA